MNFDIWQFAKICTSAIEVAFSYIWKKEEGTFLIEQAQTDKQSKFPDRIMLTWSGDPAMTQSISWRTVDPEKKIVGQIVEEQSSPNLSDGAKTVSGTRRSSAQGEGQEEFDSFELSKK